ncbi:YolD-like family protein (plasmid) [Cytobacillus firmus]|uniref:YolD-like family protein n=1 Tax=Bacillaceae TaxID=186817 RepID=UPI001FD4D587|nr:YolD-like family protein [Bacillus sp. NTK034]
MAIRDRGIMKFRMVGFQPEFVHNLRQQHKEKEIIPKPTLDEQQLEYFNQVICESMESHKEVTITYYSGAKSEYLKGFIHYFDEKKFTLKIVCCSNNNHTIQCRDIIDIQ